MVELLLVACILLFNFDVIRTKSTSKFYTHTKVFVPSGRITKNFTLGSELACILKCQRDEKCYQSGFEKRKNASRCFHLKETVAEDDEKKEVSILIHHRIGEIFEAHICVLIVSKRYIQRNGFNFNVLLF